MKKALVGLAALLLLAPAAEAISLYDANVVVSVGAGVPARGDEFQAAAKTGFYRAVTVEYPVSERVALWYTYDRNVMDIEGAAGQWDAVAHNAGAILTFDLIPNNKAHIGLKVGASDTESDPNGLIQTTDIEALGGVFLERKFEQANLRFGVDFKDYGVNLAADTKGSGPAVTGQIGGFNFYTSLVFNIGKTMGQR